MSADRNGGWMRTLGRVANLGFFFSASLLVGLFAGRTIDSWLGTTPLGAVGGLLAGVAAGFLEFARVIRQLDRCDRREEPRER